MELSIELTETDNSVVRIDDLYGGKNSKGDWRFAYNFGFLLGDDEKVSIEANEKSINEQILMGNTVL